MDIDRVTSIVARVFTFGAFLLLAVGVAQKLLSFMGASLPGVYSPRTLLELAVILEIFVIPLLLRQIRQALKKAG